MSSFCISDMKLKQCIFYLTENSRYLLHSYSKGILLVYLMKSIIIGLYILCAVLF